jgi:hypothetical protein
VFIADEFHGLALLLQVCGRDLCEDLRAAVGSRAALDKQDSARSDGLDDGGRANLTFSKTGS